MRKLIIILIIGISLTYCAKDDGKKVAPADLVPPSVLIVSPSNNSTLSSATKIIVDAIDNSNVISKVELFIDGSIVEIDSIAPYEFMWDISFVSNGLHSIYAKAYDKSKNVGQSNLISVTVASSNIVPSVIKPINNTFVDTSLVSFFWYSFPNSDKYTIQISTDINFSQILLTKTMSGLKYDTTLSSRNKYFWRICGVNKAGAKTNWSKVESFFVANLFDLRWTEGYGGNIQIKNGYCYIADIVNKFSSNMLMLKKFDTNGNIIWTKYFQNTYLGFNGQSRYGEEIDVSSNGEIILFEILNPEPKFTSVLRKLDSQGNISWTKTFDTYNSSVLSGCYFLNDGRIFTSGYAQVPESRVWNMIIQSNGTLDKEILTAPNLTLTEPSMYTYAKQIDNNNFICYSEGMWSTSQSFIMKISFGGSLISSKYYSQRFMQGPGAINSYGGVTLLSGTNITIFDQNGDVVKKGDISQGYFQISACNDGGYCVVLGNALLRLNSSGNIQWSREFSSSTVRLLAIKESNDGTFIGFGMLKSRVWIFKFSQTGDPIW